MKIITNVINNLYKDYDSMIFKIKFLIVQTMTLDYLGNTLNMPNHECECATSDRLLRKILFYKSDKLCRPQ